MGGDPVPSGAADGSSTAAPPTDAGATSLPVAPVPPGACNNLPIPPAVAEMQEPTAPPVSTGGTLVPGRYVLISRTLHTGPGGVSGPNGVMTASASEFSAGIVNIVDQKDARPPGRVTYSMTATSNQIVLQSTCPPGISVAFGYTARGDTMTIVAGREVMVMRRQ